MTLRTLLPMLELWVRFNISQPGSSAEEIGSGTGPIMRCVRFAFPAPSTPLRGTLRSRETFPKADI